MPGPQFGVCIWVVSTSGGLTVLNIQEIEVLVNRELSMHVLRHGQRPEENISRARTVVSPRFVY